MKECTNCHIKFNIAEDLCPLCQNKLLGEQEETYFPPNKRLRVSQFVLKLLFFLFLIASCITVFIEKYKTSHLHYSFWVMGGGLAVYFILYFILKNKENVFFGKYGLFLILISLALYWNIKSPVITNYIIPSFCMFELFFNLIVLIVIKNNYLNFILLNLLLLALPIGMILLKTTTANLLSYISCMINLAVLMGVLIFCSSEIKNEIKKVFNV